MDSDLSELDEATAGSSAEQDSRRWRRLGGGSLLLELGALLIAPVAVLLALGELPIAAVPMVDRYFYQAYTEHGADLIARYGAGGYYWVRLGFTLPSRLLYLAFGATGGFFVFRYLLALVAILPAYLLFRRLYGRGAGAVAVAGILSSPVVIYAWGTDYPDSSAVAYLIGGMCLLFMPSASTRARLGWVAGGGVLLTLALHSQAVSAPLVAVVMGVYLLGAVRRRWWRTLADAGILLACLGGVTLLLMLAAHTMYGHWNIITPTLDASQHLRTLAELRKWHTVDWHWVLRDPYLAVPLLALAGWLAARFAVRRHVSAEGSDGGAAQPAEAAEPTTKVVRVLGPEAGFAVILALQLAFFTWWQFSDKGYGLEYHFASSMLWPATVLVLAAAVVRVSGPLLRRPRTAAVPALLVLAVPYALTWTRGQLVFGLTTGLIAIAVLTVVVAVYTRWQPDPARFAVVAAVLAGLVGATVTGTGYALTAGKRLHQPLLPCQRPFPQPQYADVLRTAAPWHKTLAQYQLAAELNAVVPPARYDGDGLMMWYPKGDTLASSLAAQFLWTPNALRAHLPTLTSPDVRALNKRKPATLLLMGVHDTDFSEAVDELAQAGASMDVLSRNTLTSGKYTFHVWVLRDTDLGTKLVSQHPGIPTNSPLVPCGAPGSRAST